MRLRLKSCLNGSDHFLISKKSGRIAASFKTAATLILSLIDPLST